MSGAPSPNRVSGIAARVAGLTGRRRWLLALACGAMLTLAQPPVSWPVFLFVAFPLLLWLLNGTHPRPMRPSAWRLGWVAGFGYFLTGLYWIGEAFLVDIVRHGWMAPFAIGFMAGGLAIFWAAAFAVARRAAEGWPRALALAAALTLAEYARAHVFTGFPWALQAYAWVETPVAQTASLYGPHMLGLLTLIAALAAGVGRFGFVLSVVLVGAGWVWGAAHSLEKTAFRPDGYTVRVVQPNAPQREKWLPEMQAMFFHRLLDYSASDPGSAPDLIVWPETAVPFLVDENEEARRAISSVAAPAQIVLGTRRIDRADGAPTWRNSLVALGPDGTVEATYDKRHLVPFGEYMPFFDLLSRFGLGPLVGESGGFAAGDAPARIALPGAPPFAAQICYETIFPHEMPGLADRPEWILQITNDAWFGATSGPYQHLAQARMRAIETGLPLVRSANTGISAIIDPYGRVLRRLELLTEGAIESVAPTALEATPYVRSGDSPWIGLATMLLIISLFAAQIRRISR